MNLFKIYYILPLQPWAVFISLQGMRKSVRKEKFLNLETKVNKVVGFLYFNS